MNYYLVFQDQIIIFFHLVFSDFIVYAMPPKRKESPSKVISNELLRNKEGTVGTSTNNNSNSNNNNQGGSDLVSITTGDDLNISTTIAETAAQTRSTFI